MFSWLPQLPRSFRALLRDPGFSLPVFLCLVLTIGAATAVFSVVDAVLLRPLPVVEEDRLRSIYSVRDGTEDQRYGLAAASLRVIVEDDDTFSSVAWWRLGTVALTERDEPLQLESTLVGPDFFRTLGTAPLLGGGFADAAHAGEAVAYLHEALWAREFGRDPAIVGTRIMLDGVPTTVAGVIAAPNALPSESDVWQPRRLEEIPAAELHSGNKSFVGRLADGVDDVELGRRLALIDADLEQIYPTEYRTREFGAQSLRRAIIGEQGRLLIVLLAAVGLLLALGCANVANLVLLRNRRRLLAVATRAALGGSQGSIVSWLLGELLLLGGLAAAVGVSVASMLAPAMLTLTQIVGPGMEVRVVDVRTLAFTVAITLLASLAVGLVPALGATRLDLAAVLREGSGRTAGNRAARRSQAFLIGCQAAVGVLLVVAAGQTLAELQRLRSTDPGYRPDGALTFQIQAPASRYPTRPDFLALFSRARAALASLPGVDHVGGATRIPVGYGGTWFSLSIEDRPPADPNHVEFARGYPVSAGYFDAIGIGMLAGRPVEATDTEDNPPVVVVSRAFAERHWPGEPAIGKRLKRRTYASSFPWLTVVGIAADVPTDGIAGEEGVAVYLPQAQTVTSFSRFMIYVVRSDRPAEQLVPEISARLAAIDPEMPLARIESVEQLVHDAHAERRLAGNLLAVFAGIGLVLLGTGTYGVVGFAVRQRRFELGLRSALGADTRSLLFMVLGNNLVPLSAGTLVGLGVAFGLSRVLDAALLPPAPASLYALAAVALLGVGIAASLQPAWRASRLDPTLSLRAGSG